jgi:hypothetical protein
MRALRATQTRQPAGVPTIDRANPITRGLRAALVPFSGGLFDAVSGTFVRPPNTTLLPTRFGTVLSQTAGSANGVSLGRAIQLPNNQLTVITIATLRDARGLGSGTGFLYDGNASSGTGRYLIYRRGFGGTNTATSYGLYAGGTAIQEGDSGLLGLMTTGARNVISAVHNGNAHQIYKDGQLLQSWSVAVTYGAFTPTIIGNWAQAAGEGFGGELEVQFYFDRALSAIENASIAANQWQVFATPRRLGWAFIVDGVTIYRPNGDVVTSWTPTGAATVAGAIGEVTASDAEYADSPDLSTPQVCTLNATAPAGNYTIRVRARRSATQGQIRVRLLNSSSVDVGGSAWQALTGTETTYTLSATTTGAADRIRIEVQA